MKGARRRGEMIFYTTSKALLPEPPHPSFQTNTCLRSVLDQVGDLHAMMVNGESPRREVYVERPSGGEADVAAGEGYKGESLLR